MSRRLARTDPDDDDVVHVTSFLALDVVEIKSLVALDVVTKNIIVVVVVVGGESALDVPS